MSFISLTIFGFGHHGKTSAHALTSVISGFKLMLFIFIRCAFELSGNWIRRDGAQVQQEKKNSPACVPLVISRCCFAEDGKKCTRMCNARAESLFCSLRPIVFRRSRCRRCGGCLNSLMPLQWRHANVNYRLSWCFSLETTRCKGVETDKTILKLLWIF